MNKEKVELYINTSENDKIIVTLAINNKKYKKERLRQTSSQSVLPLIQTILNDHNLKLTDITEIKVEKGPGSFTGLRVGLAIANTLGFLLNIPVNGRRNVPVEPEYS